MSQLRSGTGLAEPVDRRPEITARPQHVVSRPLLVSRLEAMAERPVTLISGPAGTGKTMALAQWADSPGRVGEVVVWMGLDEADGDPTRFWATMVAALVAAGLLGSPDEAPIHPDIDFIRDSAATDAAATTFVIDDAHHLGRGSAGAWVDRLLRRSLPGIRFILASRERDPIRLARLRVEGRLHELGAADLAFTADEARDVLAAAGARSDTATTTHVLAVTGGWPAAVETIAAGLRAPDGPGISLDDTGSPAHLCHDFLNEEVFQGLPREATRCLLRTSVSGRLRSGLATALCDGCDGAALLELLERALLVVREAPGSPWFLVHPLITRALHARLTLERPELAASLHRTAAGWFSGQGDRLSAFDHAAQAGDLALAGAVMILPGGASWTPQEMAKVARICARLPGDAAARHPELALFLALVAERESDRRRVGDLVTTARRHVADLPEPRRAVAKVRIALLEAQQALRDGDGARLRCCAADAEAGLAAMRSVEVDGWPAWEAAMLAFRGVAELWIGDPRTAVVLLSDAVGSGAWPGSAGLPTGQLYGVLSVAESLAGLSGASLLSCEIAVDRLSASGGGHDVNDQWVWLAESLARLNRGQLAEARAARGRCAQAAGEALNPFVGAVLNLGTAVEELVAGDLTAAARALARASDQVAVRGDFASLRPVLTALQVSVALAHRDPRAAEALLALDEYDPRLPGSDALALALADVQLATGRSALVRATLEPVLQGSGVSSVGAWLRVSAAEDVQRRDGQSVEAMARALGIADSIGVMLPLLSPDPHLASSLRRHLELVGTHRELVQTVLASSRVEPRPEAGRQRVPLTGRELAVLMYLPTMRSNAEIAEVLFVSENTVKQHLKSIYRKLSATSRREAVGIARDAGLLNERADG